MIFSADIEDWQQSVFDVNRPVSERVLHNTRRLLDILAQHQVRGTFFVQGMVTERFPGLIRSIAAHGHELASHAYSHRPLYTLTAQQFSDELQRSVDPLRQLTGQAVTGFRAPTFSVRSDMLGWYCETLLRTGIRYDSSVMPAQIRKIYSFENDDIVAKIRASGLDCYPLSVVKIAGKAVPVMGGGYFRIYPYRLTRLLAGTLNQHSSVFYMHPYELDVTEYREVAKPAGISKTYALHQFGGRNSIARKLHRLLHDYTFHSFRDYYYPPAGATLPASARLPVS
jgi:polysaccharide deacetylase family protein (PEP-CTERM system associated)